MIMQAVALACILLFTTAAGYAQCPVDQIMLKGRVENPAPNVRVRAQLVYPKQQSGESAETTVEEGYFHLPIEFLTQSSRPLIKNLRAKCGRKPSEVVITLLTGDIEKNQITLDFPRDFTMTDASAYAPQKEIVLNHSQ